MALSLGSPPSHLLPVLCWAGRSQGCSCAWGQSRSCHIQDTLAAPSYSRTHEYTYIMQEPPASHHALTTRPVHPCLAQGPPPTLGSVLPQGLCTAVPSSPRAFARLPQMHPPIPPISQPDVSSAPGFPTPRDSFQLYSPTRLQAPWADVVTTEFLLYPKQPGQNWGN